mmetsp:Transcript_36886/g.75596  ORF Transcript_36886/g.75596 Transcript_36886/m.75596 type:complete len:218 (-) Transcript_36886:766-1419(-)
MGKNKPTADRTESFTLGYWNGKKSTYPAFRKEVTKLSSKTGLTWIIDAGRALFNKMQALQEDSKKRKKTFKDTFDAHPSAVWTEALKARENQCVKAQLAGVRVDALKERFGSNFTEHEKCGFDDETEHAEALENALELKLKDMNVILLNHLNDVIFSKKEETSSHKDFLRKTLQTAEIQNLLDGGAAKNIDVWFEEPWRMPAVVAWYQILWKYEGLN